MENARKTHGEKTMNKSNVVFSTTTQNKKNRAKSMCTNAKNWFQEERF